MKRFLLVSALVLSCCFPALARQDEKLQLPDGSVYAGEIQDSLLNGDGVLAWPNGNRFEGRFENGLRHGKGVFISGNIRIEGEWKQGLLQGEARVEKSGKSFNAKFINGLSEEQGLIITETGETARIHDAAPGVFKVNSHISGEDQARPKKSPLYTNPKSSPMDGRVFLPHQGEEE